MNTQSIKKSRLEYKNISMNCKGFKFIERKSMTKH